MADQPRQTIDADTVRRLAAVAGLNLADEQVPAVQETLNAWIPPANQLSEKMAQPEYQGVAPITVFVHDDEQEEEAG
ncbi:MAG: hypothetical protein ACRDUY_05280 [Nitriliruptorales bacterium]